MYKPFLTRLPVTASPFIPAVLVDMHWQQLGHVAAQQNHSAGLVQIPWICTLLLLVHPLPSPHICGL
jgi:hypothetical protein